MKNSDEIMWIWWSDQITWPARDGCFCFTGQTSGATLRTIARHHLTGKGMGNIGIGSRNHWNWVEMAHRNGKTSKSLEWPARGGDGERCPPASVPPVWTTPPPLSHTHTTVGAGTEEATRYHARRKQADEREGGERRGGTRRARGMRGRRCAIN